MFSSPISETLSHHVNCGKDNLTHIWYAVLWPVVCYQYCVHYRYRLVFIICMCPPPLIYIAMDWIMRYMFSLRLFKQMGVHTHVRQASPTFIHSFKHSLAVKPYFLTIKYSSILKVIGLYTISVSRAYVFAVQRLQMHWFKSTIYHCISCSFPNNLTNHLP